LSLVVLKNIKIIANSKAMYSELGFKADAISSVKSYGKL
jgi:hypothetical protein